jgi:hypothetical protein
MLLCSRQYHAPQQAALTNTVKHCSASLPNFAKPHTSPYKFKDSICNKSNTPVYLSSLLQIFFIVLYNCIRLPYSGLLTHLFSSSYKYIIKHLEFKIQSSGTTGSARDILARGTTASTNICHIFPQRYEKTPEQNIPTGY